MIALVVVAAAGYVVLTVPQVIPFTTTTLPTGTTQTTSALTFQFSTVSLQQATGLVVYGSVDAPNMRGVVNAFQSKYPYISVDYEEMTPPVGFTRITTELAGNKPSADISLFTNSITVQLQTGGYLTSYNSSERSAYPSSYQDTQGFYTAAVLLPTVFAYNTQLVQKSALPQTLSDMTNPQWRGKVIMHDITLGSTGTQYLVSLQPIVGNQTWTSFVQSLAANVHPTLNSDTAAISNNVASGQYSIGVIAYLHDVLRLKAQGAPIDWFLPSGVPLLTAPSSAALLKTAQHSAAAKLFIDYLLSSAGQTVLGNSNVRIPARPGITATYSLQSVSQGQTVVFYPTATVVAQARTWATYFKSLGFGS